MKGSEDICGCWPSVVLHMLFVLTVLTGANAQVARRTRDYVPSGQFGASVNVHLVDFDVLATTQRGRPILNLSAEDFAVLEDGRNAEIVSLSDSRTNHTDQAKASAAAPTTRAGRRVRGTDELRSLVLGFDYTSLSDRSGTPYGTQVLSRGLPDIERFVRTRSGASTQWTVVLLGLAPYAVTDWTTDPKEVARGLERVLDVVRGRKAASWALSSFVDFRSESVADAALLRRARLPSDARARGDAIESGAPLDQFLQRLAGCSQRGSASGATATSLQSFLGSVVPETAEGTLILYYAHNLQKPPKQLSADCAMAAGELQRMWRKAAETAQAAGFHVYAADLRGLDTRDQPKWGSSEWEKPGEMLSGVSVFRIQEGAFLTAHQTGGRDIQSNDWQKALQTVFADDDLRYRLTIRVPHARDGRLHELRVRLEGHPGAILRYRRAYVDLTNRDRLLAQLEGSGNVPRRGGALPIEVDAPPLWSADHENFELDVTLSTPAQRLGWVETPGGGRSAQMEFLLAVYGTDGSRLKLERTRHALTLPAGKAPPSEPVRQRYKLDVPAGRYTVVGAVYDAVDKTTGVDTIHVGPK